MCKACEIGKVVVNMCLNFGFDIDTAKLQKLLVLMHGLHLARYDEPLFPENVLMQDCGVVIKEVDDMFISYAGGFKEPLSEKIAILNSEEQIIKEILSIYGNKDVFEIRADIRLKHLYENFNQKNQSVIIDNLDIKKVFIANDI